MTDRYVVISADCHAGLPTGGYRDYLDPEYREAFDESVAQRNAMTSAMQGMRNEEFIETWFGEHEEELRGGWDARTRDRELDGDGVAGEVIFPDADAVAGGTSAPFSAGLGAGAGVAPELFMAGARAHNRWLTELCSDSPERRAGVAIVPILHDIEAAVSEIERAAKAGLRGGILIPPIWGQCAPYHDQHYDPIWAACQASDMPVHTHCGPAPHADMGGIIGIYNTEVIFWATRPLWHLIWGGAFDRFPGLKFVPTESSAYWAADLLWICDIGYDREHGTKKLGPSLDSGIEHRPSHYFDKNVWIGASTIRRRELARRYDIGVQNIMWGNDFPHPEGTWPNTREWLRNVFWDIPVDEARLMLGLNAAEVYNFDLAALGPIADRIGPTPEELGQVGVDLSKWDALRETGREWLSGREAVPVLGH